MPFAITGAKYASASISAIGTTTVQIGTAPFVQSDFTLQRLVGLWSSAGVFKGLAWVRRFVSTSRLELERSFFDPASGVDYRLIPTPYTPATDGFYSGFVASVLSGLICTRGA